jgi:hypothetical protein
MFTSHAPQGMLRVGGLAKATRSTVGKLVDRVAAAGLIARPARSGFPGCGPSAPQALQGLHADRGDRI